MGWLFFLLFAAALLVVAWRLKLPRGGLQMIAAILALAGAGYAAQGHPDMKAAPGPASDSDISELADRLFEIRALMDRNFGPHVAPLALSDSALRSGKRQLALAAINGALKNAPDNPELLNGRALALYIAARGEMTPAVRLAFEDARVGSEHPGPDYFEGLAALFNNDPKEAQRLWESALARKWAPGDWHASVEAQLAMLRRIEAQGAAQQAGPNPQMAQ